MNNFFQKTPLFEKCCKNLAGRTILGYAYTPLPSWFFDCDPQCN